MTTTPGPATDGGVATLFIGQRVCATLDTRTAVARLRLTRAAERNAIDAELVSDLNSAVAALHAHAGQTRALLISADGPSFTVGGDLAHFNRNLDQLSEELVAMIGPFHETMATLAELPLPVVCAVQGGAAGGGLGLLWAADIVIAAEDLQLVTAFSRLGVSGDGGGTWYLPQLVGLRRALELMLESPVLNATQALDYGLVTRVVPRDALADEAEATVANLANGPTRSIALQRTLIRRGSERSLREGLAAELEAMRLSGQTSDAKEGMAAFMQRRKPAFKKQ